MASNGKKKTTMAKLNRERRLQEKRLDKQARKERRKEAAANPVPETDADGWLMSEDGNDADGAAESHALTEADGTTVPADPTVGPDRAGDAQAEPVAPARPL